MNYASLLLLLNLATQESALKTALAQAESAHPVNMELVDAALLDYAQFLHAHGRYGEAESLYLRSNETNPAAFGPTSRQAAQSHLRLGILYNAEQRFEEAEQLIRKAALILQTLSGPDSLDYAYAMANLATVLAGQGKNDRAEPVLRRAIFLIEKHSQSDPVVPALYSNLGLIYLRQGEFSKSKPILLASLDNNEDGLGRANSLAALAELSIAEHRWSDADTQIRQAYHLIVNLEGDNHPWLIGIMHLRALIEAHTADARSAVADLDRAIGLLEALAGHDSPSLLPLLDDYATALRQARRKPESKAALRRAKSIRDFAIRHDKTNPRPAN